MEKQKAVDQKEKNMSFWNSVSKQGHSNMVINPYQYVKNVTLDFGRYGDGWWIDDERFDIKESYNILFYFADLYLKGVKHALPMASSIDIKDSKGAIIRDLTEKVRMNALINELTKIGYNIDVFLNQNHNKVKESTCEAQQVATNVDTKSTYKKEIAEDDADAKFISYVKRLEGSGAERKEIKKTVFDLFDIKSEMDIPQKGRWPFFLIWESYTEPPDKKTMAKTINSYLRKNLNKDQFDQIIQQTGGVQIDKMDHETMTQVYRSMCYMLVRESIDSTSCKGNNTK